MIFCHFRPIMDFEKSNFLIIPLSGLLLEGTKLFLGMHLIKHRIPSEGQMHVKLVNRRNVLK